MTDNVASARDSGQPSDAPPWPVSLEADRAAVSVRGLTKRFGSVVALDAVDLTVPSGARFLLAGPNGAGKTTLLSLLLDLVRPTAGIVRVLGLDPVKDGAVVRSCLGYVAEQPAATYGWMTVGDVLRHHAAFRPSWDAAYEVELCQALEIEVRRPFGKLSKGQIRRVELVMALAHAPPLLLLDEPTDGLDPVMRNRVVNLLRAHADRFPTSLLVSTHVIHEVDGLVDHIAVLRQGRCLIQTSRDDLDRCVRHYRVAPGSAPPPGLGRRLVATAVGDDGEPVWTIWGDEAAVRQALMAGGVEVRDASSPTLEQALLAFLAPDDPVAAPLPSPAYGAG
ncbi:MAG TPA: ABC transporter ATP-binding protein [Longimicrobiales bacterium]